MIIGEFDNSNFDDYEEDSYDYLFKRKSKAEREEKRLTRKANSPLKKSALIPGRRKLPLVGNFGMFDKNRHKNKNVSPNTIQVGVNSAGMNKTDASTSTPTESEPTPVSSSTPAEGGGVSAAPLNSPGAPVSSASPSDAEVKIPASAINSIASPEGKSKPTETEPPGTATNDQTKGDAKKSNVKEAGFSAMLGFAFLGIAIILAGYAIFKADQKSRKQLNPLKATA